MLELLYARHTFVNTELATHYGMELPPLQGDEWVQVDDATPYGRGGLLTMAVFLTKNSPGLRTSPVKRGYWIVRRLLGERIPPPAADRPRAAGRRGGVGRANLSRNVRSPSCRSQLCAPATNDLTPSDWFSRTTVRWANAAIMTWEGVPWKTTVFFPTARKGRA